MNVPEVVLTAQDARGQYMITCAVPGVPLAERIKDAPALFDQALRQLQAIDIADCPFDAGRGGKADRWLDIAFIHRNLREELDHAAAKRRFFEQLDELF